MKRAATALGVLATTGLLLAAPSAFAGGRHSHHGVREGRSVAVDNPGVRYDRVSRGGSALVSDGPGTGFGFHRLPEPFRFGAAVARDRQVDAVHRAVIDSAISNANIYQGYPGSSVYQYGQHASYGVFSGGDSYGTPYFAGWYGPGDGEDLGPLGRTYR